MEKDVWLIYRCRAYWSIQGERQSILFAFNVLRVLRGFEDYYGIRERFSSGLMLREFIMPNVALIHMSIVFNETCLVSVCWSVKSYNFSLSLFIDTFKKSVSFALQFSSLLIWAFFYFEWNSVKRMNLTSSVDNNSLWDLFGSCIDPIDSYK
jgi:hypothetical protein